jgi:PAS domain S-box-containing protein
MPAQTTAAVLERLLSRAYGSADQAAADVCRSLAESLGYDLAFVSRVTGDTVEIVAVSDRHGLGLTVGSRSTLPDSFCGRALSGRGPQVTADIPGSAYADVPGAAEAGLSSYAMVPLRDAAGDAFGTLCVLDRGSLVPDDEQAQLMRLLGGLLAREQELERVRRRETAAAQALASRALELETSQHRYRSLVDEMRDIVVRLGADGTIEFVNGAWTELTGIPVEDVLGRGCFDWVHPEDREAAAEHLAAVAAGNDGDSREVRFRDGDGRYRWLGVTGRALFDDAGGLAGFTGLLQDVTDRRINEARVRAALGDAESARDEAQAALVEAERASSAKSEFLSRMSHELRTPLNAILGFGQLLELSDLVGEDAEHVGLILAAGRHLLELINEVLDVVRIESGRLALSLEPVPVGPVVAESLALLRTAAADRGLTVLAPAASSRLHVLADQQRLTQVLVNLLSNAVKYNRTGGRLTVEVSPLDGGQCPGPGAGHGWLRLSVTDTGLGIAPSRLADAFTAFERLGAELTEVEGTGIGLSLSKTLVEAMDGRIGVLSEPGRGSTFYVDLPAAAPVVVVTEDTDPLVDDARRTVLYVEDNRSNITLMQRVLARRPNVRLVVATDGEAGLDRARSLRPELVLLDLHLPVLNGEEVLAALRADPTMLGTAVVVVTADLTSGTERRLLDAGADGFLSKPIDIARLLAVVDDHLPPADADTDHTAAETDTAVRSTR